MRVLVDPTQSVCTFQRDRLFGISVDADEMNGDYKASCLCDLESPVVRALCRELRPGTFRVGGYGIQKAWFVEDDPDATAKVPEPFVYSFDRRKAAALAEFCNAVGCDLMMSLPLRYDEIENAGRIAEAAADAAGPRCAFLEMDNEPDWGWKDGDHVKYADHVEQCHEALAPKFPGVEWIAGYGGRDFPHGPCNPDSGPYMELLRRCGKRIDVFVAHYYRTASVRPWATPELLLDEVGADIGFARVKELRTLLEMYKLPNKKIGINEFNTFACQGMEGVSNTMRAAVWMADFMGHLAQSGVYVSNVQASFAKEHVGAKFWRYAMIDTRGEKPFVNPHYYAFYLWTRLMGDRVLPMAHPPLHPLSVHATADTADPAALQVILINKDLARKHDLEIKFVDTPLNAEVEVYRLTADGPAARNAFINQVAAKDDGSVQPIRPETVKTAGRDIVMATLPPCSVTVLTVRKA